MLLRCLGFNKENFVTGELLKSFGGMLLRRLVWYQENFVSEKTIKGVRKNVTAQYKKQSFYLIILFLLRSETLNFL